MDRCRLPGALPVTMMHEWFSVFSHTPPTERRPQRADRDRIEHKAIGELVGLGAPRGGTVKAAAQRNEQGSVARWNRNSSTDYSDQ